MASALLLNCRNYLRAKKGAPSGDRVFMKFLYLCRPFPLEFLCTLAEILAVKRRELFAPS